MLSRTEGVVIQTNQNEYTVDLYSCICSCSQFQKSGISYSHSFSCIFHFNERPSNYVPDFFKVTVWKATYLENLSPIFLTNLVEFESNVAEIQAEISFEMKATNKSSNCLAEYFICH